MLDIPLDYGQILASFFLGVNSLCVFLCEQESDEYRLSFFRFLTLPPKKYPELKNSF